MKILTITNYYPPCHGGGYGLQMGWYCDRLAERGHQLRVVTSLPPKNETPVEVNRFPVARCLRIIEDSLSLLGLLRRSLQNYRTVKQAVREYRPNVIFCGGFDGIGFNTYLAAIEAGFPTLTWLGDTWLGQAWRNLRRYDSWVRLANPGGGIRGLLKRPLGWYGRSLGLYDGAVPRAFGPITTLSQFVLDDLRNSAAPVPADASVVPVSLHPAFFKADGEAIGHSGNRMPALRALFVSRMEMLKGPDTAIRAVAVARALGANVTLSFAGLKMEELRPNLQELAQSHGVAEHITWRGTPNLEQLIELYRNHDVFLFPSRIIEGLGVVNVEALACGLPIIGTAHSGSAEVIIHGESGFRIQKDDHEAMGRYLAQLNAERNLLEKLSEKAITFAKRFAPDRVIDALESALLKATEQSPELAEVAR